MAEVNKAVLISDLSTQGRLVGNQMRQFIRLARDQQVMIKMAQALRAEGGKVLWSTIDYDEPVTIWNMHGSAWPSYGTSSPSFGGQTLTTVSVEAKVELDKVLLPSQNIEQDNIEATIVNQLAKAYGNDLERAAILADSDGSDPYSGALGAGMLTAFDGWYEKIRTSGTVYDHQGGKVNAKLFYEMWENLPTKYQTNPEQYRFFVAPKVGSAWTRYLASVGHSGTEEGWVTNTERGQVAYAAGIELVRVPKIPVNKAGILSQSSVTQGQYSFVILAQPENLVVAFDPEIEWEIGVESDIRRKVIWVKAGFVAGILNPEACVVAVNVLPQPDSSVAA